MDDHEALINQFVSLTSSNYEKAREFLQMYHWQLQDAVNTYLTVVSSQKFEKHVEDRLPKKRNLITTSNPEIQLHRKSDSKTKPGSPPFDLMFRADLKDAYQYSSDRKRYLIINIQNQKSASTDQNIELWSNYDLKTFIKSKFIFWQGKEHDAVMYTRYHPVSLIPHIAILDTRTGENLKIWERPLKPSELKSQLEQLLVTNPYDEDLFEIPSSLIRKNRPQLVNKEEQETKMETSKDDALDRSNMSIEEEKPNQLIHPTHLPENSHHIENHSHPSHHPIHIETHSHPHSHHSSHHHLVPMHSPHHPHHPVPIHPDFIIEEKQLGNHQKDIVTIDDDNDRKINLKRKLEDEPLDRSIKRKIIDVDKINLKKRKFEEEDNEQHTIRNVKPRLHFQHSFPQTSFQQKHFIENQNGFHQNGFHQNGFHENGFHENGFLGNSKKRKNDAKEEINGRELKKQKTDEQIVTVDNDVEPCLLKIRLTQGQSLHHTFNSNTQLLEVYKFIKTNRTDVNEITPFYLILPFPRKVFSDSDMKLTLKQLGLGSRVALIIQNKFKITFPTPPEACSLRD